MRHMGHLEAPHPPRCLLYIEAMPLTVLLVDSDETRAHALAQTLSGFAQVLRADGAGMAEAVEKAKPDLVIVDMALPDRDALEDIRAVSSGSPH
jgi:response regulator NasT